MPPEAITVPKAPELLPVVLQKKWRENYLGAYEQLKGDQSLNEAERRQRALIEANRILRLPVLTSYQQAMELADWQVIHRQEKDGQLKLVTIEGKKYVFEAPRRAAAPEEKKKD